MVGRFLVALWVLWVGSVEAFAYGPGVHIRECSRLAELLAQEGDPLSVVGEGENRSYLYLGCVAPDLRQVIDSLKQVPTHSRSLGLHLLEAAQKPGIPERYLAFALGHLAHHFSDGSAEALLTPHMTAAGLLGGIDILEEANERPEGENELFVEVLGDIYNGDMAAFFELLWAVGSFGETSLATDDLLEWYAQEINVFLGDEVVDSMAIWTQFDTFMNELEAGLGEISLEGLPALLELLADLPPAEVVEVLFSMDLGGLGGFLGIEGKPTLDSLTFNPVKDLDFFASKEGFAVYPMIYTDLGPRWTIDAAHGHQIDEGWPAYSEKGIRSGIRNSLAHGMPKGSFSPTPHLSFDEAHFTQDGAITSVFDPAKGPATARVRLYASAAFDGWVDVRVMTTSDTVEEVDLGQLVGRSTVAAELDPKGYVKSTPRLVVLVPCDFAPWIGKTKGVVIALATGPSEAEAQAAKPFMHGSWLLYQAHNALDTFGMPYDPFAHTYDGYPQGMRLPEPPESMSGGLILRVLEAPHGNAIPELWVDLSRDGQVLASRQANGVGRALFDGLEPGDLKATIYGEDGTHWAGMNPDGNAGEANSPLRVAKDDVTIAIARAYVAPRVTSWSIETTDTGTAIRILAEPLAHRGDQVMRLQAALEDLSGETLIESTEETAFKVSLTDEKAMEWWLPLADEHADLSGRPISSLRLKLRFLYRPAGQETEEAGPFFAFDGEEPSGASIDDSGADVPHEPSDVGPSSEDVPAADLSLPKPAESGCSGSGAPTPWWSLLVLMAFLTLRPARDLLL